MLVIPGPPVSKGRPIFTRGHAITPRKTREAQERIAHLARHAGMTPLAGECAMICRFFMPTRRKVDTDNLLKLLLDSMNGIAYADDSQVSRLEASRHYCPECPRTEVEVWPLAEEE